MTGHEQRMSERDWAVGDFVMVTVEVDEGQFLQVEAEVMECTCESFDTFRVVFCDPEEEFRLPEETEVAGCDVEALSGAGCTGNRMGLG